MSENDIFSLNVSMEGIKIIEGLYANSASELYYGNSRDFNKGVLFAITSILEYLDIAYEADGDSLHILLDS